MDKICSKCRSDKMALAIPMIDKDQMLDRAEVIVLDPKQGFWNRVFNDNTLKTEIFMDICGNCGHIEFRIKNPQKFYLKYQELHPNESEKEK